MVKLRLTDRESDYHNCVALAQSPKVATTIPKSVQHPRSSVSGDAGATAARRTGEGERLHAISTVKCADFVEMMPDFLARAFAPPEASIKSHSLNSFGAQITARIASDVESRLAPLHAQTIEQSCVNTVRQMSGELITRISSKKLKDVLKDVLDQGFDMRADADALFFEELDSHKLDVTIAKNEGLDEIRVELDQKREDLMATAEEVVSKVQTDVQRLAAQSQEALRAEFNALKRRRSPTMPGHRSTSLPL